MTDRFLPYSRQQVTDTDVAAVVDALKSPIISQGVRLEQFEKAFASVAGASFGVGFSSGTAALHAMCFAAGIGPGDEVLVPAMTFAATANAVRYCGGTPVFVDVEPDTVCIDPDHVQARASEATKAILAVDFAGHPADYTRLRAIADELGFQLLCDGAHSPGCRIKGSATSSFADMVAYSFNPVKNITSAEGGMVVTSDRAIVERLIQFRTHGMTREEHQLRNEAHGAWYYEQQFLGYNYKLSELHAALGLSQLARLEQHNDRRRGLAAAYHEALADLPLRRPTTRQDVEPVWHLYVIRVDRSIRRALFDHLRDREIGVQVHYLPVPMHPYYRELGYGMEGLANAMEYYESALSLPLHPSMSVAEVDRVVTALRSFFH